MKLSDYINHKPVLTTERLILRELVPSDVDALRTWTPDKTLYRYWGKNAGKADKNPELLFATPAKPTKSFHWGIALKENNRIIGEVWVYLIENDRMAKIAFRVGTAYQNQGYTTEAVKSVVDFCFTQTELQRLWTDVHVDNIASVRVLEKAGFQKEGLIRQGKMVSTYCDYYIYGMLRAERRELGVMKIEN